VTRTSGGVPAPRPTRQQLIDQDVRELAQLGYAQQLFREMGGFSNFAIYAAAYSVVTSISTITLYLAYVIPIYLNWRNRWRRQGEYTTAANAAWGAGAPFSTSSPSSGSCSSPSSSRCLPTSSSCGRCWAFSWPSPSTGASQRGATSWGRAR
jgi:hypothetical protein